MRGQHHHIFLAGHQRGISDCVWEWKYTSLSLFIIEQNEWEVKSGVTTPSEEVRSATTPVWMDHDAFTI